MLDEHMGPIKKYSILTVGAVVLALANYVFKFPNHFSFGGVAGFAVILSGMFGGSASTYTFVINMLLLLIAFPIGKGSCNAVFLCQYRIQWCAGSCAVCVSDRQANHEPAGAGACIFFYAAGSVFRDILLHGCVQRRNRYYCFDIKKVYQRVNRNGVTACRLRSCCDFFLCI